MPEDSSQPFRVFYSWQSDLPKEGNEKLIRAALDEVVAALNGDSDLHIQVTRDEATSNLPGSPNIAAAILEKIRVADVFVCDLSKVAEVTNAAGEVRKYCNPNVAIELGYAIRVLGWDRIVLVFNKAHGKLPDDLPFDARSHRTLAYTCLTETDAKGKPTSACKAAMSNARGQLKSDLMAAMTEVLAHQPKRPEAIVTSSPADIKRQRDVEQLRKVFHWIHLGVLGVYIQRLGDFARATNAGVMMYESLRDLVADTRFYLSDVELRKRILAFVTAWGNSQKYAGNMEPGEQEGQFLMPGDLSQSREQEKQVKYTMAQAEPLRKALEELKAYVSENYVEIDLTTAGEDGWKEYKAEEAWTQAARKGTLKP